MGPRTYPVFCVFLVLACGDRGSGGDGDSGGAGNGGAAVDCTALTNELDCTAEDCAWREGLVFAGPSYDCSVYAPAHVCTDKAAGGLFDTTQHWRRDTADGRVVLAMGQGEVLSGYEMCGVPCGPLPSGEVCDVCPCVAETR